MNEKKLTDDEIIKALENESKGYGAGIVGDLYSATLDLISHQKAEIERLTKESNDMFDKYGAQIKSATILIDEKNNEIEQLKAELAKECEEHLAFAELAKKADEQQKAEISELKAQCSKSSYRDSWKNKFFKAQEEIERLTEWKDKLQDTSEELQHKVKVLERALSHLAHDFNGQQFYIYAQSDTDEETYEKFIQRAEKELELEKGE